MNRPSIPNPADFPADKGQFGGHCNRSACLAPNATWYNHSTRLYYCEECAKILNYENRFDSARMFGHDLCTPGLPELKTGFQSDPLPPSYTDADFGVPKFIASMPDTSSVNLLLRLITETLRHNATESDYLVQLDNCMGEYILKVAHKKDGINGGLELSGLQNPMEMLHDFMMHYFTGIYFKDIREKKKHVPDFACKNWGPNADRCTVQCGECLIHNPFPNR